MRKNIKELVYKGVLAHVRRKGIADISTVELAKEIGVPESVIFYHYKTARGIVDECAVKYDQELTAFAVSVIEDGKNLSELWDIMFEYVLQNPDGADFYFSYVNYYGFDPTEGNIRASEFLASARKLFKEKPGLDDHTVLFLWDYLSTQLFYYCDKITRGYLVNDKTNKDLIKKTVLLVYDNL